VSPAPTLKKYFRAAPGSPTVAPMKMHDGEAEIDAALVQRLVAAQFP